jgi:hypothetical protein
MSFLKRLYYVNKANVPYKIVIRIPVSLSIFSTDHHHLTRSVHRSYNAQIESEAAAVSG